MTGEGLTLELIEELAGLGDLRARRQRIRRLEPPLDHGEFVATCSQVLALHVDDPGRSKELATALHWLASERGDDHVQGLAARTMANVLHSSGDIKDAQELYDRALGIFQALDNRKEVAVTRSSALQNLSYLGDYQAVYASQKEAREVFESLGDRLRLANLANNFGNILYRQDRWTEALERYRFAFEEFVKLGRTRNAAICLRNLTVCHISLHNFNEALAVYEKARMACDAEGLRDSVLQLDYNIAYLFYLRGEYTQAIQRFQAARRASEEEKDEYHQALCDLDQAEIYLELNLVDEAARLSESAFAGFEKLEMPYESGKALTNDAIAVGRLGRSGEALDLLSRARAIFEQEGNTVWQALIDFYQAVVLYRARRPQDAVLLATGAREAFDASALAPRAVMCAVLIARLYLEQKLPDLAREACHDALERLEGLEMPALEHQVYFVLGQVEEAVGDRQAALEAYGRSQQLLERLRSQLQGEDLKIAFFKDKFVVYESLVWLTMAGDPTAQRNRATFDFVEKAKSRSLADLMSFRAYALPARVVLRQELLDQVKHLREELNWFYRQIDLQELSGGARSQTGVEDLRRGTRSKEDELLRLQRELQATDREYGSLQTASTVDLELFRQTLPENAVLVEYFIARGKLLACVVDHQRLEIVELTSAQKARELHRFLQFQLARLPNTTGGSGAGDTGLTRMAAAATSSHLRELHRVLIEPLAPLLQCEHLIIAPHGFLHYVPFHALYDGTSYLVDRYTFSYTPSAGVFHLCATKEVVSHERSLVLGVADERAPHILGEVQAVAEALPEATLLVGEAASEEALRQHAVGCRYVHIATHGLFRRDNPMFSAIQLGTTRLSLFDLYNLRLDAQLVVLSGCGTGLNAVFGADELVGLTRGLLYAGAQSVLVTLWDVHDASTAAFMLRFYQHLGDGDSVSRALQRAMLDLREEYPHPYHWAPFVLVGQSTLG